MEEISGRSPPLGRTRFPDQLLLWWPSVSSENDQHKLDTLE